MAPAYVDPAVEFAKGLPPVRPMPDREFTAPEALPGTVYIVLHDHLYLATSELKIGFSRVPSARIKEPQRWSPGFRMVASVQVSDMRAAEDELHRTFENARCNGTREVFTLDLGTAKMWLALVADKFSPTALQLENFV